MDHFAWDPIEEYSWGSWIKNHFHPTEPFSSKTFGIQDFNNGFMLNHVKNFFKPNYRMISSFFDF